MNLPASLQELHETLARRRGELEAEVRAKLGEARMEHVGPETGTDTDGGDSPALSAAGEMLRAEVQRDLSELGDIEAAQKRLAEGTYGICIDCGQQVDAARLRAWPAAARCLGCQTSKEATHGTGRQS